MSLLFDIIQAHVDAQRYPPSNRRIAKELGVSPGTIGNWQRGALPDPENLRAIARLTGTPYSDVLTAALRDRGYLDREIGEGHARPASTTPAGSAPAARKTVLGRMAEHDAETAAGVAEWIEHESAPDVPDDDPGDSQDAERRRG